MTAINATPMATVHIGVAQDAPPSPTLTNPDLILPYAGASSSPAPLASSPILPQPGLLLAPSSESSRSGGDLTRGHDSHTEVGVATAVRMPIRLKPGPPTSVVATPSGYEHGAPLDDITEEEMTPRSRVSRKSRSPSPVEPLSPTPPSKTLRHKKRLSDHSSSGGSDVGDWENFDTSKMMTGRLAADVAREDDEDDGPDSQRNSLATLNMDDRDEMAILNAKAEKILENARKRLTHMEDNLTKARHSVYLGDRVLANMRSSPNMSELHQPAGGLYRSISLASRRSKPLYPVVRTNSQLHSRGSSDTTTGNGLKRLSMIPEARSSSAQEYNRRNESPQHSQQTRFSPSMKYNTHSPSSSRSINSPMRTLEEERESPSTIKTSPESGIPRGLGINTLANETKEDLSVLPTSTSPTNLTRSESAASTRSIREQMTELRSRISDLQIKTRVDKERRQSARNTPSPFTNSSNPEQWYTSAPEYKEGGSPYSANAGVGWSPTREKNPSIDAHLTPVTPQTAKFLETEPPTTTESARIDLRTDVNTPNLHQRTINVSEEPADAADSIIQESLYEDAAQDFDDEDPIAASEEEQIYLNEVLEESLQDVEPEVPDIPDHLLPTEGEAERHEDRLDAFDYENMFLHSAMGNFVSDSRSRSPSESSESSSVATRRAEQETPTAGLRDAGEESDEQDEDDETILDSNEIDGAGRQPIHSADEDALPTPTGLQPPPKPWAKHPQRSQSVESVSTVATFATATEGGHAEEEDDDDDDPNEILTWGNGTTFPKPPLTSPKREMVGAWPKPPMNGRPAHQQGVVSPVRSPGGSVSLQPQLNVLTGNAFNNNGMPTPMQSPMASGAKAVQPLQASPIQQQEGQTPTSQPDHPANTEILMESLIKLADPEFKVQGSGNTFADVDKDLVLSLLRAVGGVCDGVLKADKMRATRDVKVLRRRLDLARRVLEGESGEE